MNRSWTTLIIVLTVMILRTLRSVALSGVEATTSGPGTSRGSWLAAQREHRKRWMRVERVLVVVDTDSNWKSLGVFEI